jgi:hypothetical protein
METVVHNVRELAGSQRSAAEQLVGHALNEDQQIVIQVVNLEARKAETSLSDDQSGLPDWFNVYQGLSDEEIASLEQAISQRLDLKRANELP